MKKIPLTQGKFALVDDEDFDYLSQFRWMAHYETRVDDYYAIRNGSRKKSEKSRISMARVLMNTPEGMVCDHIDLNTLNNQKANLRNCTVGQNNRNRGVTKSNTSGYKGVFAAGASSSWFARIGCDNRRIYIGCYSTPEEAARAYDQKAKELHGEFAKLNFGEPNERA